MCGSVVLLLLVCLTGVWQETGTSPVVNKVYFKGDTLREVVELYPYRRGNSEESRAQERAERECFLHFLGGLLRWDPQSRWLPEQAAQHPFILKQGLAGFDQIAFEKKRFAILNGLNVSSTTAPAAATSTITTGHDQLSTVIALPSSRTTTSSTSSAAPSAATPASASAAAAGNAGSLINVSVSKSVSMVSTPGSPSATATVPATGTGTGTAAPFSSASSIAASSTNLPPTSLPTGWWSHRGRAQSWTAAQFPQNHASNTLASADTIKQAQQQQQQAPATATASAAAAAAAGGTGAALVSRGNVAAGPGSPYSARTRAPAVSPRHRAMQFSQAVSQLATIPSLSSANSSSHLTPSPEPAALSSAATSGPITDWTTGGPPSGSGPPPQSQLASRPRQLSLPTTPSSSTTTLHRYHQIQVSGDSATATASATTSTSSSVVSVSSGVLPSSPITGKRRDMGENVDLLDPRGAYAAAATEFSNADERDRERERELYSMSGGAGEPPEFGSGMQGVAPASHPRSGRRSSSVSVTEDISSLVIGSHSMAHTTTGGQHSLAAAAAVDDSGPPRLSSPDADPSLSAEWDPFFTDQGDGSSLSSANTSQHSSPTHTPIRMQYQPPPNLQQQQQQPQAHPHLLQSHSHSFALSQAQHQQHQQPQHAPSLQQSQFQASSHYQPQQALKQQHLTAQTVPSSPSHHVQPAPQHQQQQARRASLQSGNSALLQSAAQHYNNAANAALSPQARNVGGTGVFISPHSHSQLFARPYPPLDSSSSSTSTGTADYSRPYNQQQQPSHPLSPPHSASHSFLMPQQQQQRASNPTVNRYSQLIPSPSSRAYSGGMPDSLMNNSGNSLLGPGVGGVSRSLSDTNPNDLWNQQHLLNLAAAGGTGIGSGTAAANPNNPPAVSVPGGWAAQAAALRLSQQQQQQQQQQHQTSSQQIQQQSLNYRGSTASNASASAGSSPTRSPSSQLNSSPLDWTSQSWFQSSPPSSSIPISMPPNVRGVSVASGIPGYAAHQYHHSTQIPSIGVHAPSGPGHSAAAYSLHRRGSLPANALSRQNPVFLPSLPIGPDEEVAAYVPPGTSLPQPSAPMLIGPTLNQFSITITYLSRNCDKPH